MYPKKIPKNPKVCTGNKKQRKEKQSRTITSISMTYRNSMWGQQTTASTAVSRIKIILIWGLLTEGTLGHLEVS